ncbi:ABC transporter ATP-binding protein [Humidisolicoccus flavus]|uniref:ABC transporter ATP-binding protein n=1 Tax=Humidisolicoccus flavus TaxID=3111414 RepID=UPI00324A819B
MSVLEFRNVSKQYNIRGSKKLMAVNDVSFTLEPGKTIALVGQSGSGKSTIAKMLVQLERPSSGQILLDGKPVSRFGKGLRDYRREVQMVFQDPFASLNPFHTIAHHLARPLLLHKQATKKNLDAEVERLLERVQLVPGAAVRNRKPHELSGGQRQRVAIARALAPKPSVLIADEPVSMLDVSIRLGVLNLLGELQRQENLGVLYITHDLATARHFSDEIMVLYQGVVVEQGPSDEVILNPQHEYTKRLRDASPNPEAQFAEK